MPRAKIILVDDDTSVRDALTDYLVRNDFDVRSAADGEALDAALADHVPDVVILDVMMPGEDGLSICRRLSADEIPVLMLSALGTTMDKVVGLEIGAADYLPKPFEPRELLARIRAILRRNLKKPEDLGRALHFDGWRLQLDERALLDPDGDVVPLTSGDYRLLLVFAERPRRLLSRDQLMELSREHAWDAYDRAVDLAVSRLRRKLGRAGALIETVRGEGYRFKARVSRA